MTVADLIEFLKTQPQDLTVAYAMCSEYDTLQQKDISVMVLREARADGWIHNARPDKPTQQYLVFPGN